MRRRPRCWLFLALIYSMACGTTWAEAGSAQDEDMGRRLQKLLRAHQADVFACVGKQPATGEVLLRIVVGGDHVPEVLKADAAVQGTAECVAVAARSWDLSALGASVGDQVVFPLAFAPEPPGARNVAVGASLRERRLQPRQSMSIGGPGAVHAIVVQQGTLVGRTESGPVELRAGDTLYLASAPLVELVAKARTIVAEVSAAATTARTVRIVRHAVGSHVVVSGEGPFTLDELCLIRAEGIPMQARAEDELVYVERGRVASTLSDKEVGAGAILTIPRGTPHALSARRDSCLLRALVR